MEEIPKEIRDILRVEAKAIKEMPEDESDILFISPNTSNRYFIHHGIAELDGGVLDR